MLLLLHVRQLAGIVSHHTNELSNVLTLHRCHSAVRWLSYVFALVTCLNKATLVANTVAADPFIQARCQQRNSGQGILWFGVPKRPTMTDTRSADGKPAAPKAADAGPSQ